MLARINKIVLTKGVLKNIPDDFQVLDTKGTVDSYSDDPTAEARAL